MSREVAGRTGSASVAALVALRLAVGWHFLYEGVLKLQNPYWTSADYLAQSLSRSRPWKVLGMSRASWYRAGKPTARKPLADDRSFRLEECYVPHDHRRLYHRYNPGHHKRHRHFQHQSEHGRTAGWERGVRAKHGDLPGGFGGGHSDLL